MNYLWITYMIIWGVIFFYVWQLGNKQNTIIREIKELRELYEEDNVDSK